MDRTDFMNHVYWLLSDDTDNNRANSIIDAADEYAENAVKEALEGGDINVPTNSALDHIHNVVAENERKRGYEQAKAEYDHKLTEIRSRIKDHYYNLGYEQGKKDATPKWISVSERLPEEKINPNTQDFEEVLCSTTFGDVRAYRFGTPCGWKKPHFWHGPGMMDEYVLAWMEKPKPWKGE